MFSPRVRLFLLSCYSSGPGQGNQGNNSGRLTSHRLNSFVRVATGKLARRVLGSRGLNPLNRPLRVGSRAYFRLRDLVGSPKAVPGTKLPGHQQWAQMSSRAPTWILRLGARARVSPVEGTFLAFSLLVSKFHNGYF